MSLLSPPWWAVIGACSPLILCFALLAQELIALPMTSSLAISGGGRGAARSISCHLASKIPWICEDLLALDTVFNYSDWVFMIFHHFHIRCSKIWYDFSWCLSRCSVMFPKLYLIFCGCRVAACSKLSYHLSSFVQALLGLHPSFHRSSKISSDVFEIPVISSREP